MRSDTFKVHQLLRNATSGVIFTVVRVDPNGAVYLVPETLDGINILDPSAIHMLLKRDTLQRVEGRLEATQIHE